eukprot:TRINITY_DN5129_c0_g1_i1.p1 TRINITY_DN5129_c0_g1~~TRINITY_DN5129_c0_g1_i1.p1  ORF type:complete len:241 (+),score=27.33 TRINITY_DN5129_c0_g1_i1:27-725(+)
MSVKKREDNRLPEETYAPCCRVGILGNAQGSAYVEYNGCKIVCSVFGPKQIVGDFEERASVKVSYNVASFAEEERRDKRQERNPSTGDRHTSSALSETLNGAVLKDKYPKSLIEINFLVLERTLSGSEYPLAVMAASLALTDAGIELHELPIAASVCLSPGGELLVTPTPSEIRSSSAVITVTCFPQRGSILSISQTGTTPPEQTEKAINLCVSSCVALRKIVADTLKEEAC